MQENDYILLLNKRFSGDISVVESALLDAWIGESPMHAELAVQYQMVWEKSAGVTKTFTLDLDAEFERLQRRLERPASAPAKVAPIGTRLLRIAAILALLITAVWGYRQWPGVRDAGMVAYTAQGNKELIQLPDGSRVWLRQGGHLVYATEFDRSVQLDGEAYFEVKHDPAHRFRVELPHNGWVDVLGTAFNVIAYAGTPSAVVLVRQGSVRFSPDGKKVAPVLLARDRAEYNRESSKLHIRPVSTFNELAWQTGGLEFIRTPLKEVIADLEDYYNVHIELQDPALGTCLHTAPLTHQPIERVLESLSLTYQMQVSNPTPGQFILSGGSCK